MNKMDYYREIDNARKVLGLPESATHKQIQASYRQLAAKYHPDRCKQEDKKRCQERFKEINHAYDLLCQYCANYLYSFEESEVKRNSIDKNLYQHLKRFYDGWWGNLDL
jgi:DnaJ-class molecular chaperone